MIKDLIIKDKAVYIILLYWLINKVDEVDLSRKSSYTTTLKGGEANFSFHDFEPDFLNQYLLKY